MSQQHGRLLTPSAPPVPGSAPPLGGTRKKTDKQGQGQGVFKLRRAALNAQPESRNVARPQRYIPPPQTTRITTADTQKNDETTNEPSSNTPRDFVFHENFLQETGVLRREHKIQADVAVNTSLALASAAAAGVTTPRDGVATKRVVAVRPFTPREAATATTTEPTTGSHRPAPPSTPRPGHSSVTSSPRLGRTNVNVPAPATNELGSTARELQARRRAESLRARDAQEDEWQSIHEDILLRDTRIATLPLTRLSDEEKRHALRVPPYSLALGKHVPGVVSSLRHSGIDSQMMGDSEAKARVEMAKKALGFDISPRYLTVGSGTMTPPVASTGKKGFERLNAIASNLGATKVQPPKTAPSSVTGRNNHATRRMQIQASMCGVRAGRPMPYLSARGLTDDQRLVVLRSQPDNFAPSWAYASATAENFDAGEDAVKKIKRKLKEVSILKMMTEGDDSSSSDSSEEEDGNDENMEGNASPTLMHARSLPPFGSTPVPDETSRTANAIGAEGKHERVYFPNQTPADYTRSVYRQATPNAYRTDESLKSWAAQKAMAPTPRELRMHMRVETGLQDIEWIKDRQSRMRQFFKWRRGFAKELARAGRSWFSILNVQKAIRQWKNKSSKVKARMAQEARLRRIYSENAKAVAKEEASADDETASNEVERVENISLSTAANKANAVNAHILNPDDPNVENLRSTVEDILGLGGKTKRGGKGRDTSTSYDEVFASRPHAHGAMIRSRGEMADLLAVTEWITETGHIRNDPARDMMALTELGIIDEESESDDDRSHGGTSENDPIDRYEAMKDELHKQGYTKRLLTRHGHPMPGPKLRTPPALVIGNVPWFLHVGPQTLKRMIDSFDYGPAFYDSEKQYMARVKAHRRKVEAPARTTVSKKIREKHNMVRQTSSSAMAASKKMYRTDNSFNSTTTSSIGGTPSTPRRSNPFVVK